MKKLKKKLLLVSILVFVAFSSFYIIQKHNTNPVYRVGQVIDSLHHVKVYYNGGVGHVAGRNTAPDGYNLGLKYQCVEFVKRYYYEHYNHKMPDSYGHAKDFFDPALKDGQHNKKRNLIQFSNPSDSLPREGDLVIFSGSLVNPYGHVAIISEVNQTHIEIIQQNPGPRSPSRITFKLERSSAKWEIGNERILGWLRMRSENRSLIHN